MNKTYCSALIKIYNLTDFFDHLHYKIIDRVLNPQYIIHTAGIK